MTLKATKNTLKHITFNTLEYEKIKTYYESSSKYFGSSTSLKSALK